MSRRVGIDLIDLEEVHDSVRRFGDRYLATVYTEAERQECGSSTRRMAEHFAAKEAAMKALAPADRLPWHSIALTRGTRARPELLLSGAAAACARRRGVTDVSVSLCSAAGHAGAIVVTRADR